ncbi:hypothetical protein PybrP1_004132 [[Pythium] brassicae (nom. inval.)]|nr:hypothetical protein PybrP1_004132 [[Pythium] brassicae (nom. inval.)]
MVIFVPQFDLQLVEASVVHLLPLPATAAATAAVRKAPSSDPESAEEAAAAARVASHACRPKQIARYPEVRALALAHGESLKPAWIRDELARSGLRPSYANCFHARKRLLAELAADPGKFATSAGRISLATFTAASPVGSSESLELSPLTVSPASNRAAAAVLAPDSEELPVLVDSDAGAVDEVAPAPLAAAGGMREAAAVVMNRPIGGAMAASSATADGARHKRQKRDESAIPQSSPSSARAASVQTSAATHSSKLLTAIKPASNQSTKRVPTPIMPTPTPTVTAAKATIPTVTATDVTTPNAATLTVTTPTVTAPTTPTRSEPDGCCFICPPMRVAVGEQHQILQWQVRDSASGKSFFDLYDSNRRIEILKSGAYRLHLYFEPPSCTRSPSGATTVPSDADTDARSATMRDNSDGDAKYFLLVNNKPLSVFKDEIDGGGDSQQPSSVVVATAGGEWEVGLHNASVPWFQVTHSVSAARCVPSCLDCPAARRDRFVHAAERRLPARRLSLAAW